MIEGDMILGDLKVQWGIVNAAHHDFADVAQAVDWAQQEGYHTVYIPAGEYRLTSPISICTPHFSLLGAGPWNTTLKFTIEGTHIDPLYAIRVQNSDLIEGVRLADFTVQPLDGQNPAPYEGGILLVNCHRTLVERVHSKNWHPDPDSTLLSFGFKAERTLTDGLPAGEIMFNQCSVEDCFYGIWLTGKQEGQGERAPLLRCSVVNASLKGIKVAGGIATGGSHYTLADNTPGAFDNIEIDDWVHNLSDDSFAQISNIIQKRSLLQLYERWQGGADDACTAGDAYVVTKPDGRGIYIENARGTLVQGGTVAYFGYGVYVEAADGEGTKLGQIAGLKFNVVDMGVYISSGVKNTQVVAMTQLSEDNHVDDRGTDSLVVGLQVSGDLSAESHSLWLTQQVNQFRSDVGIRGLADASVPDGGQAGTVTRYAEGLAFDVDDLDPAFDHSSANPLPDGFTGVYYATKGPSFYLVTRANNGWRGVKVLPAPM